MNTLHLYNVRFWGRHGAGSSEHDVPQPFCINVSVEYDFTRAIQTEQLSDTIDYKIIETYIQEIIEGKQQILLETLTNAIAEKILTKTNAASAEVRVTKLRAQSFGIPSVKIKRVRSELIKATKGETVASLLGLNAEKVAAFYSPQSDGILHFKGLLYTALNQEKMNEWQERVWPTLEKREEHYIRNSQEVGILYDGVFTSIPHVTNQQEVAIHTLYHKIRSELERYSDLPFEPSDLLEIKFVKYNPSGVGIAPHKDMSSDRNAIIIMNLSGSTVFYTASDKKRTNERSYAIRPGDITIMRAPRTTSKEESALRPIHYVLSITESRSILVFREINKAHEAIVNKDNWRGF